MTTENPAPDPEPDLEGAITTAFLACGKAGADADPSHPLRPIWEHLRGIIDTSWTLNNIDNNKTRYRQIESAAASALQSIKDMVGGNAYSYPLTDENHPWYEVHKELSDALSLTEADACEDMPGEFSNTEGAFRIIIAEMVPTISNHLAASTGGTWADLRAKFEAGLQLLNELQHIEPPERRAVWNKITDRRKPRPKLLTELERLEDEHERLINAFGRGPFQDGLTQERLNKCDARIAELKGKQP